MKLQPLLVLGAFLGLGLAGSKLANRLRSPQILGSVLIGVCLGPQLLGLLDEPGLKLWRGIIVPFTLSLIGFGIGSELKLELLKKLGRSIFLIALGESLATFLLVGGVVLLAAPPHIARPLALLLAALAVATAPTTVAAVLRELRASGQVTTTTLAVIGIDDVLGLLAFAVALPFAARMVGDSGAITLGRAMREAGYEVLLSPLLGLVLGGLLTLAARPLRVRGEVLIATLAALTLAAGLARQLQLSVLLVTLTAGMVLSNRNRIVANRVYEGLSSFIPPFYVLFFVLVGANIQPARIGTIGLVGVLYILARLLGKWTGAAGGAALARAEKPVRRYIGLMLLSQGGVVMALALLAAERLEKLGAAADELGQLCLTVIAGSTLLLYFVGPPAIKLAIGRAGEANQARF